MTDKAPFEIPDAMRELAERNVEQARAAYDQFMEMARQAGEMMTRSGDAMASGAREVQSRTMKYVEQNMTASFALASELAHARDMKDYFEIQSRHAQRQMRAYADQAQELGRLLAEVGQRAQRR